MNHLSYSKMSSRTTRHFQRQGSVALMLILVLTLLVGTFTISVTSRMSHERRSQWNHGSVALLESAIDCVVEVGIEEGQEVRLPVDEVSKRWIMVKMIPTDEETLIYQATIYRNGEAGMFVRRRY